MDLNRIYAALPEGHNSYSAHIDASSAGRDEYDLRVDSEMELLVDLALEVARTAGIQASAEIMHKGGVPFHVSTRVLLRPEQRRTKRKA